MNKHLGPGREMDWPLARPQTADPRSLTAEEKKAIDVTLWNYLVENEEALDASWASAKRNLQRGEKRRFSQVSAPPGAARSDIASTTSKQSKIDFAIDNDRRMVDAYFTPERANKIKDAYIDMLLAQGQPLTLGEKEHVKRFFDSIGGLRPPSYAEVKSGISKRMGKLKDDVAECVSGRTIALAYDQLTRSNIKVGAVTASVIDAESWTMKRFVLGIRELNQASLTAEDHVVMIKGVLADYRIDPSNVIALNSDGAADMAKMRRLFAKEYGWSTISCVPHYLACALGAGLSVRKAPEVAAVCYHVRALIGLFKKSSTAYTRLNEAQQALLQIDQEFSDAVGGKARAILKSCATRWTSKIDAIERMCMLWKAIKKVFEDNKESQVPSARIKSYEAHMTAADKYIEDLTEIVRASGPLLRAIRDLQADTKPTLSKIVEHLNKVAFGLYGDGEALANKRRSEQAKQAFLEARSELLQQRKDALVRARIVSGVTPAGMKDGERTWLVERILSERKARGKILIKVKWLDWPTASEEEVTDDFSEAYKIFKEYGSVDLATELSELRLRKEHAELAKLLDTEDDAAAITAAENAVCKNNEMISSAGGDKVDICDQFRAGCLERLLVHPLMGIALYDYDVRDNTAEYMERMRGNNYHIHPHSTLEMTALVCLLLDPKTSRRMGITANAADVLRDFTLHHGLANNDLAEYHLARYRSGNEADDDDLDLDIEPNMDDEVQIDDMDELAVDEEAPGEAAVLKDKIVYLLNKELRVYHDTAPADRKLGTEFWRTARARRELPFLRHLAAAVHCIPAGQTACERIFSGVARIFTPDRNRLKGSTMEQVTILRADLRADDGATSWMASMEYELDVSEAKRRHAQATDDGAPSDAEDDAEDLLPPMDVVDW